MKKLFKEALRLRKGFRSTHVLDEEVVHVIHLNTKLTFIELILSSVCLSRMLFSHK